MSTPLSTAPSAIPTCAADRYGDPAAQVRISTPTIDGLIAHRSVRRFLDTDISDARLEAIITAAQSASTSSNLQAWSVIAIRSPKHRARLAQLAGRQAFVAQAPLLLLWVADLSRHRRLAATHGTQVDATDHLETTLLAALDAALAAQNAVVALESLGLGATYVGAFRNHPVELAADLGLPRGAFVVFGMAVGVPDPDEAADIKPRLPRAAVLHHERYDAEAADLAAVPYDERLTTYNQRFGLPGAWTDRVLARLAGPESMAGRAALRTWLTRLGLPSH